MNATPEPDVRMFDNGETRSTENATVVTDEKRDLTHPSPPPDYSSDSAVTLCQSLEFKDRDLDPWAGKSRCVTVADPESGDGDDYQYPGGVRLALLFSSLCMTLSLVALDSTIVSTAAPTLAEQWGSLTDIGWYGSAYLLPLPTLQPLFGKMYPYFDTKYGFLVGLTIFELGSLICALANASNMFIAGRTVAGIGAALLAPGIILIVADTVPRRNRPIFTGMTALAAGVAASLGPVLGGIFTTKVTWRWCFYLNLPLSALAAPPIILLYTSRLRAPRDIPIGEIIASLDLPGAALLSGGIVSLLLAFTFAAQYSWSEPKTIILLVLAGVLLTAMVIEQAVVKPNRAMLPRSILKKRGIILCSLFGFLVELASTSHVYYLPFYFQGVLGTSAEQSGVNLLPYLVSQTVAGIMTGIFIHGSGYFNPSMLFGTVTFTIGAGFLKTLSVTTTQSEWIGYLFLAAFGAGCSQFMAMGIAQQLLTKDEESIGLSMVYTIKQLGSAIAVSICSTIFNVRLTSNLQSSGIPASVISHIKSSLTLHTGVIQADLKGAVANAVAKSVDDVFIVPIVAGGLAFVVGSMHNWTKIQ